jgi:hypothetical protein
LSISLGDPFLSWKKDQPQAEQGDYQRRQDILVQQFVAQLLLPQNHDKRRDFGLERV